MEGRHRPRLLNTEMVNLLLQAHRELDAKDNIEKILTKTAAKYRPKKLLSFGRRNPQMFNLSPNASKSRQSSQRDCAGNGVVIYL